jgi:hypothetical protein
MRVRQKKLYQTPIGSFVRSFLHWLSPSMPILVCSGCYNRTTDEPVGPAGDFSVCDRCKASITMKTGLAVRRKT